VEPRDCGGKKPALIDDEEAPRKKNGRLPNWRLPMRASGEERVPWQRPIGGGSTESVLTTPGNVVECGGRRPEDDTSEDEEPKDMRRSLRRS
jgi:hypothetical protein